jgi:hypothetical protein
MFLQERNHGFDPHIAGAAGITALNDRDGFSLVKWRLRRGRVGAENQQHEEENWREEDKAALFRCHRVSPFLRTATVGRNQLI